MGEGVGLLLILLLAIVFIVIATSRWKIHPFIVLIVAAYGVALASGLPFTEVEGLLREGFGKLVSYIGLIIIFGTLIGTLLEKSGAAIVLAEAIIKILGKRYPGVAMSMIGYIVSIPVFCDSAYIILSSLKKSIAERTASSPIMMSVALATGLFVSHTLIPPTPGPIAAAGNLGLDSELGLVIIAGLAISIVPLVAGYLWASWIGGRLDASTSPCSVPVNHSISQPEERYTSLPKLSTAVWPILAPILFIAMGSIAAYPGATWFSAPVQSLLLVLGKPLNALFIGFILSLRLLPEWSKVTLGDWMGQGLQTAGNILLITGAGGAFGHILQATPIGQYLGATLVQYELGLLLPFIVSAALKTSQGSSTVAMVTTSALVAPLLVTLGLDTTIGMVLTVMAIGAGAMTVSHANDSFFWVVAEFSDMTVETAYKCFTVATFIQGSSTLISLCIISALWL